MNPVLGWVLMVAAVAVGGWVYGWQGVVMVISVGVFWLLLQFNRSLRVLKNAGHAPVGMVPSGVMLNARLRPGMTMLQIVGLTRSLGRQPAGTADTWIWTDEGGATVTLVMNGSRLESWRLTREESPAGAGETGTALPSP